MSWRIKRHRWNQQKNKRTTWRGDAAERRTSSTCETNQVEKWPVWLFLLTVRERKHPINWKQDWTATGQSHRGFWHQPEFDLYLHPSMGPVHLVSVNAPTLPSRNKGEALWWTWGDGERQLYLLGDLNARPTDHNSWPPSLGHHRTHSQSLPETSEFTSLAPARSDNTSCCSQRQTRSAACDRPLVDWSQKYYRPPVPTAAEQPGHHPKQIIREVKLVMVVNWFCPH